MQKTSQQIHSLYESLRARISRAVVGIVPPREVEDIVQEAYVRLCRIQDPNSVRAPSAYLLKAARNLALDYVKRSENRLADSLEETPDALLQESFGSVDSTFDAATSNEEFSLFCDAVRQLPVQCRRAFVLRKVYGYTQREIAREMGISENTVEKHISLGLGRCINYLKRRQGEHTAPGRTPAAHDVSCAAVSIKEPGS